MCHTQTCTYTPSHAQTEKGRLLKAALASSTQTSQDRSLPSNTPDDSMRSQDWELLTRDGNRSRPGTHSTVAMSKALRVDIVFFGKCLMRVHRYKRPYRGTESALLEHWGPPQGWSTGSVGWVSRLRVQSNDSVIKNTVALESSYHATHNL